MARRKHDTAGSDWSRRGFLRSAAAAAGGLAVGAPAIVRAASRGDDTINLAVIGAGAQGWVLVNNCVKIGKGLRFLAVCDIWPRNRKVVAGRLSKYRRQDHPARPYEDYREMLAAEKDLDAVIVATPDCAHAEQAIRSLEAGLHVYCEKEMSNDLAKAREMVLAGRRSGKRLQIGHQRRSNPRYHTALEYIDGLRACGRLTYVQGHWNRCRYLIARWKPSEALDAAALRKYGYETMDHLRNWRYYRKHSGGLIADLGSHQIDIFHWFLHAHPKAVMANGGAENYPRVEWYDHILAQYEWDYLFDGERRTVRGHWQACSTTGYLGYREAFLGTEGSLVISENTAVGGIWRHHEVPVASWERDYVLKVGPSGAVRCHQPIPAPVPPKTEHMPHLENFFAAIRDSRVKLNCPGEVGYETAVSVLRANEAVEAGRRLTFEPEDFAV